MSFLSAGISVLSMSPSEDLARHDSHYLKATEAVLKYGVDKALIYRSDELTNVYYQPSYMMYDFMALGVDRD
jgi:hypothetical protein